MFSAIGTVLLILTIVLGGSGATVAAAQQSMPDNGLYPVKTWSEDLRVKLTENEQTRLQLALDLVNRRAEEMQMMLRAGQVPPPAVETRMQAMIDFALQLSAGQPEPEQVQALKQIRTQLQKHEQEFLQMGPQKNIQGEALIERTRRMLQDRLRICDAGIQDPAELRNQLRDRDRTQDGDQPWAPWGNPSKTKAGSPVTGTPTPGSGYGPGPGDGTSKPTDGGGNNPWVNDTPTPGSGYGPGPGDGSGDCDGCGEGGMKNTQTVHTPAPGSGPGPGPQPDPTMSGKGDGGGTGPGDGSGSGEGTPGSGDGGGGGGGGG
jgi:uncharacterized membrane protein YgcG